MSKGPKPAVGTIGWIDLTVKEAEKVKEFYAGVVGWEPEAVDMGGYSDFNMKSPATGEPAAGVCHKRGGNAEIPSSWMVYIHVADLATSARRCTDLGGKVLLGPKGSESSGRYCIVEDPAGAVVALFQAPD
jgi:predicted enzyme related to lactoylglutathione lyase